jgi:hypothetical protein
MKEKFGLQSFLLSSVLFIIPNKQKPLSFFN